MKLRPLSQWICDDCGEVIEEPRQGWCEWISTDSGSQTFRIVHNATASPRGRSGCLASRGPNGRNERNNNLTHFVGFAGMLNTLDLAEQGVVDAREWAVFFKRLFVPFFEEARCFWAETEADGLEFHDSALATSKDETLVVSDVTMLAVDSRRVESPRRLR